MADWVLTMNIFEIICDYLESNRTGILATVVKRTGSAPRDIGAKMFIGEDGKTFGTVGGGLLESEAYRKALEIVHKGVTEVFSIDMNARSVDATNMLCGGNVEILLEPVTMKHFDLYRQIDVFQKNRKRGLIVTRFGNNVFEKTLLDKNLNVVGDSVDREIINLFKPQFYEKKPSLINDVFVDPIRVTFPLYLFGAGHVSQYVAKIAKIADFHITVIDDRKEFANSERFPNADVVMVTNIQNAFRCLEFSGNEYVVILTRSHEYDGVALEETLKKEVKYVGMIGSIRKVRIILDSLKQKEIDHTLIETVHAPIGVAIDAETPQEIAISIVAELIRERAKA
jgi:xanthine dehydrogenase accessory factor